MPLARNDGLHMLRLVNACPMQPDLYRSERQIQHYCGVFGRQLMHMAQTQNLKV
jgi:hypothetical protein